MIRNDADDFALRLFSRVPAHYRYYDVQNGYPLLALLRVVAAQAANLHTDLEALWDNFFIETCVDWAVPYIGALVGAEPLRWHVPQSDRLNVWNTVRWRRGKGSASALREVANQISGWPSDAVEMFRVIGAAQTANQPRLTRPFTPDLHSPADLALLGGPHDRFGHSIDISARRYRPTTLGVFVRRLQTFALHGVTPAAAAPGQVPPDDAGCYTFDPLFESMPLFDSACGAALTRASFGAAPWASFGKDLAVRQFGVLLASDAPPFRGDPLPASVLAWEITNDLPEAVMATPGVAHNFHAEHGGRRLHESQGLVLADARAFQLGGVHFTIAARWRHSDGIERLGMLSTFLAAEDDPIAFRRDDGRLLPEGHLELIVETGRRHTHWPLLGHSSAGRFPGAVVSIRLEDTGPRRAADVLYVYLPPAYVSPSKPVELYVAADGSTYFSSRFDASTLARASEGQLYPARDPAVSSVPVTPYAGLSATHGVSIVDHHRFGEEDRRAAVVYSVGVLQDGRFFPLGSVASVPNQAPAFQYRAAPVPPGVQGVLAIQVSTRSGSFVPQTELVVTSWDGASLLVYLPELRALEPGSAPVQLVVAEDGTSYFTDAPVSTQSYFGLTLARGSAGQVLPIVGSWPIRQRTPVARDLTNCDPEPPLRYGELGIDPQTGRFALPIGDPAIEARNFSVDYVEAFTDRVGARPVTWETGPLEQATRLVARSAGAGSSPTLRDPNTDAPLPVHDSVEDAVRHAQNDEVIEILDSATYPEPPTRLPRASSITLRAARGQRPCLTYYTDGRPASASLRATRPLGRLKLVGLLMSGGPLRLDDAHIAQGVELIGCTLDPLRAGSSGSVAVTRADPDAGFTLSVQRCISGPLRLGAGMARLVLADSIVQGPLEWAIDGSDDAPARAIDMQRVTVLGRLRCETLQASNCLLDLVYVDDRQSGYIRFSAFQMGSQHPCRFRCVTLRPVFNSRRFGQPAFGQLSASSPDELLMAGEDGGETGAFAGALNTGRLRNLEAKLIEFLPAGMTSVVIAQT
jgi:hypothetical protein